jgi:hypothetical protein
MQGAQGLIGGGLNGAGAALGLLAEGGEVEKFDTGGVAGSGVYVNSVPMNDQQWNAAAAASAPMASAPIVQPSAPAASPNAPKSMFAQTLKGINSNPSSAAKSSAQGPFSLGSTPGATALNQGLSSFGKGIGSAMSKMFASSPQTVATAGGAADVDSAPISSGAELAGDGPQMAAAYGGNVGGKLKSGGHVPGKPKVGGAKNSYANDTVKALLSPGEIVIPRNITMGKDPINQSAKFVQSVLAKRRVKR